MDRAQSRVCIIMLGGIALAAACSTVPIAHGQAIKKHELVTALEDALKNPKEAPELKIVIAKALIRIAPDNKEAAQELVNAMASKDEVISALGYRETSEVISLSPPALIAALIPLLKNEDRKIRAHTIELLGKVDPQKFP